LRDLHSFPTRRSSDLWILEKYHGWSDRASGDGLPFTDDFLLTQASIYWFTNTIGTSLRPYYEALPPHPFVTVPTALALFPADLRSEEHTSELQSRENL